MPLMCPGALPPPKKSRGDSIAETEAQRKGYGAGFLGEPRACAAGWTAGAAPWALATCRVRAGDVCETWGEVPGPFVTPDVLVTCSDPSPAPPATRAPYVCQSWGFPNSPNSWFVFGGSQAAVATFTVSEAEKPIFSPQDTGPPRAAPAPPMGPPAPLEGPGQRTGSRVPRPAPPSSEVGVAFSGPWCGSAEGTCRWLVWPRGTPDPPGQRAGRQRLPRPPSVSAGGGRGQPCPSAG